MEDQLQHHEAPSASRTVNLTATSTLFWRLFVPLAIITLLTVASLVFILTDEDELFLSFPAIYARIVLPLLLFAAGWWLYKTPWKLRRVDVSEEYVYVTDYWTHVRYPWSDVEKVGFTTRLGRKLAQIHLRAPGRFGQVITFLPNKEVDSFFEGLKIGE